MTDRPTKATVTEAGRTLARMRDAIRSAESRGVDQRTIRGMVSVYFSIQAEMVEMGDVD